MNAVEQRKRARVPKAERDRAIPALDLAAQHAAIRAELDEAIRRVLDSGQFVLGPEGEALERELGAYCGASHAVGVASGTDALELALKACGIGIGDEVLTPALSFFATAEAIVNIGAIPVFVDVDPQTYVIDPEQAARRVTPRTKAILPVHLYGHPCDMEALGALARRHGLRVIEDCAQAIGASHQGRRVGAIGDAGALSFYPTKNLGGLGDGGMVLTNQEEVARAVRLLRHHGDAQRYEHVLVGRNSRLDELQAATLRVKLRCLDRWTTARRMHAARYGELLGQRGLDSALQLPVERPGAQHVYHLYIVRTTRRQGLFDALQARGIGAQVHYPVALPFQPALACLGYRRGEFPVAEQVAAEAMSLPVYPELTDVEIERVVYALDEILRAE